jgi:uncharacterized protein
MSPPSALPAAPAASVDPSFESVAAAAHHADADEDEAALDGSWRALPRRARRVFLYAALSIAALPALIGGLMAYKRLPEGWEAAAAAVPALLFGFAAWLAFKRYRYTFWKLDEEGFAVRRGRIWHWETRVPTTRVQHLDMKRGPLERMHGLASLVVHTAGTRLGGVSISGLDLADAERVRDYLSREIERRSAADDTDDDGQRPTAHRTEAAHDPAHP